jgi:hypothetical protein
VRQAKELREVILQVRQLKDLAERWIRAFTGNDNAKVNISKEIFSEWGKIGGEVRKKKVERGRWGRVVPQFEIRVSTQSGPDESTRSVGRGAIKQERTST